MLTGEQYLHSNQKTYLDRTLAASLIPAYTAAKMGAAATFGFNIYSDLRVGQNGALVAIPKIMTLDENGQALSAVAESYRQKGLDELPQIDLILRGVMSIVGTRHLLPDEYDMMQDIAVRSNDTRELLYKHRELVLPAKRGLLSTFALHAHITGEDSIRQRLMLDVEDHENASLRNDVALITKMFRSLTANELANGMHQITENENKSSL